MAPTKRALHVITTVLALAALHPNEATAEPEAFLRMDQTRWLDKHQLGITYGMELKAALQDWKKPGAGGGGGGGLDGRKSYKGVVHRLWTGFGLTEWLSLGAEHTMGQAKVDAFEYKVLSLQVRLHWRRIFKRLPLELDSFVESRVRVNARRKPSAVVGMGAGKSWSKVRLAGSVGFETTLNDERRENGLRYEVGLSYRPWKFMMLSAEIWGILVWPDYSVFQHSHHGGPSLMFLYGRLWLGANVALGMKDRPHRVYLDISIMAKLGVQL